MCCHFQETAAGASRRRTAFTLVELLVVISVIAILMGILMPALGRARSAANRAACQSNLRQIGIAFRAYLDDSRDIMPPACAFPWDITDKNDPNYRPPITQFLGPVLKSPQVFICLADTKKKYYLMGDGGTSYKYREQLGGRAIRASSLAQRGVKERDIDVMSDFDSVHPKRGEYGGVNYLYADWHVSDYRKQD